MAELSGVVGALLTPFDASGEIDRASARAEVDFLVSHCDAVSVLGAEVSEYRCLTPAARRRFLVEMLGELEGRTRAIAGVSAPTVAEAVELANLAEHNGAEFAQLLLPARPYGGQPADSEVVRFVERVAADCPLPLVLYHHPGQGADPSLAALIDACAVPGVVAIKDSSRDISRNLRLVEEIHHAGHAQYLATIQPMLAVLLSGGAGAMMPPPLTLVGAAIRDAVAKGDLARAGRAQRLIATLPARWSARGLTPLAKKAMELVGVPVGDPFPPYEPVPEAEAARIGEVIESWADVIEAVRSATSSASS